MSLINEALRKAQRDRSPNSMSEPEANAPMQASPSTGSGMKPGLVIGLVIAIALLIGLVAGLSIVLFRGEAQSTEQFADASTLKATETNAETAVPPERQAPASSETAAKSTAAQVANPEPALATNNMTEPFQREVSSPMIDELREAREAAEAKVNADRSEEIIDWLARAKINGVKLSESKSRVILNGEPYGAGEYVNFNLGLRVMIIQEKRVLFVDSNGKKYLKRI